MEADNSGIQRYFAAIQKLQTQVIDNQLELLGDVADAMAATIGRDGRIFLFGTGHSHLLAEEGFFRAGGLAPVIPILLSSLMLHESAILSAIIERTAGLAEPLLNRYNPRTGDLIFIFSNSGVNRSPVEMALAAKEQGLTVVSVSSLAYAQVAPLSELGRRLDEVADFAIDNGGQPGDSLISIEGVPWPVGPSSTVIGSLIWNALVTEAALRLHKAGAAVPIFVSANMQDATERNEALLRHWKAHNPHI